MMIVRSIDRCNQQPLRIIGNARTNDIPQTPPTAPTTARS
eukprot:CAMPEP_0119549252 /NCGR_PEP_ID=MMETSP1352-20130426/2998_1 /TAXON_ID=265584 /ORGANISM="Stauroneis constricta, Strain CCMP1120" /LENGTH=39 /DNA_ID= /DNA_START= /DNA_END= /DNA_ORIENTATION=